MTDQFVILEEKIKQTIALITQLREENQRLREGSPQGAFPFPGDAVNPNLVEKVTVLEKKVKELELENKALLESKEKIKEKVQTMLEKFDIMKL